MNDHYYLLNDLTLQWQIDFRGANPNENLTLSVMESKIELKVGGGGGLIAPAPSTAQNFTEKIKKNFA